MTPNVAKCLLVSKVLVADGIMTDHEKEFLDGVMTKLGLSEAEPIVDKLSEDERRDIVSMLVDAAGADGKLSANELATVKRVAAALRVGSVTSTSTSGVSGSGGD